MQGLSNSIPLSALMNGRENGGCTASSKHDMKYLTSAESISDEPFLSFSRTAEITERAIPCVDNQIMSRRHCSFQEAKPIGKCRKNEDNDKDEVPSYLDRLHLLV